MAEFVRKIHPRDRTLEEEREVSFKSFVSYFPSIQWFPDGSQGWYWLPPTTQGGMDWLSRFFDDFGFFAKKTDTNGICMVNSFSPKLNCWRIRTPSTVWHLTIYGVCWKITQTLSMGSNHSLGLAFLGTYTGGRCWCCDQAPGASGCQHETWQSEPGLYFLQETEAIVQYFPPSYPSFKINL